MNICRAYRKGQTILVAVVHFIAISLFCWQIKIKSINDVVVYYKIYLHFLCCCVAAVALAVAATAEATIPSN